MVVDDKRPDPGLPNSRYAMIPRPSRVVTHLLRVSSWRAGCCQLIARPPFLLYTTARPGQRRRRPCSSSRNYSLPFQTVCDAGGRSVSSRAWSATTSRSTTSRAIPTRTSPGCAPPARWRGCRRSAASWSPGVTRPSRSCATRRRSPSTIRGSRPPASSGRACCRSTAPTHDRHRTPFVAPFRPRRWTTGSAPFVGRARRPGSSPRAGQPADLRTALAAPLPRRWSPPRSVWTAVTAAVGRLLGWYRDIVGSVSGIAAGSRRRPPAPRRWPRWAPPRGPRRRARRRSTGD